jgi:DNA repair photolyase
MADVYGNALSLTSQLFFCGLPLRLDSYRGCGFQCPFCYARYRGGNAPDATVTSADPGTLRRVLSRALDGDEPADGLIGQFLRRRVPIHFGGMSDPFQPAERRGRVTRHFLEALADHRYPTVISTRSTMPAEEPYLGLLRRMPVVVQFSMTSTEPAVARRLEPHSPDPGALLATMERLAAAGVIVTSRWQPFVPGMSEAPPRFVSRVAAAGARHVALEHLKLPVETAHPLWAALCAGTGRDLRADYAAAGARRDGREFVLPAAVKLPTIRAFREATRAAGLSMGVADNEFQYLSDTGCCCSGVDAFAGFGGWFKHQIAHAVRRCRGRDIVYGAIARYWTPTGSIDRWLNSRTRIGTADAPGTLAAHIRDRWNDAASPLSPAAFHGVEPTERWTDGGFRVYRWSRDVRLD